MKTAILISGQLRTFARCLPTLRYHVFRCIPEPAFFVSAADDSDAKSAELLREAFPNAKVEIEIVKQPTLDEPPLVLADSAPYAITPTRTPGVGPLQGILRQLWHMSRVWAFAMEKGAGEAELFVRCRPDLHFQSFALPYFRYWPDRGQPAGLAPENELTIAPNEAFTPWWGNFGGVNDRFALLGRQAAEAWFKTFDVLPELLDPKGIGCPFHPESLVAASLERSKCVINRTLRATFAFRRRDGTFEHATVLPDEIGTQF